MSETPGDTDPLEPDDQPDSSEEAGVGRDEGRLDGEEDDGSESLEHGGGGAG